MKESAKMRRQVALVACNGGCRNTSCGYGCIGCGACASECPQGIIRLHEAGSCIVVKCSNRDPGKIARAACQVSCIGCGICEKACPSGAAKVKENLSVIDEALCLSCGMCAVKCPRHAIYDLRGVLPEKN